MSVSFACNSAVRILLTALVLSVTIPVAAQQHRIDAQRSTITVRVYKSGLFRAFADNHVIRAPLAEGAIDDSASPHVELVVDVNKMRVLDPGLSQKDRSDVQARMLGPDVLDSNRFAQIRFQSTDVRRLQGEHWVVRGNLNLHGQNHPVEVNVSRENGAY